MLGGGGNARLQRASARCLTSGWFEIQARDPSEGSKSQSCVPIRFLTTHFRKSPQPTSPRPRLFRRTTMSATLFWRLGAVLGASGVALGAFGAHGLKVGSLAGWLASALCVADGYPWPAPILPVASMLAGHPDAQRKQENWATAAHYQLIHAAALLALSTRMQSLGLPRLQPSRAAMAGWLLVAGVAGFSGSIYLLVLDTRRAFSRFLGPVTPLGGVCFIAGWALMAMA
nr:hypothetical protein HK105_007665 [Polyrhizophydium stewartii]